MDPNCDMENLKKNGKKKRKKRKKKKQHNELDPNCDMENVELDLSENNARIAGHFRDN